MSVSYLPFDQNLQSCKNFYINNRPLMERQSKQMTLLNSSLTIFTSWTKEQIIDCAARRRDDQQLLNNETYYPGIVEQAFDADELLRKYNFTDKQTAQIQNWHHLDDGLLDILTKPRKHRNFTKGQITNNNKKHVAARLADLWRLLLAREYQLAYLDLDMFPLDADKEVYLGGPNVAVPIWGDEQGALEIQNSGYCFTPAQLDLLIKKAKSTIDSKGDIQYYHLYTDMGPALFQRSIQALSAIAPTRFLFTTSNNHNSPKAVLQRIERSENEIYWLHLDGRFRKGVTGSVDINTLSDAFNTVFGKLKPRNSKEIIPHFNWSPKT